MPASSMFRVGLLSTVPFLLGLSVMHVMHSQVDALSASFHFQSVAGDERSLKGHVIERSAVTSLVECGLKCARLLSDCKSLNYITEGQSAICEINNSSKSHAHKDDFVQQQNSKYFEPIPTDGSNEAIPCLNKDGENEDEKPTFSNNQSYVDGPWTLVARFSNNDAKNWMEDQGTWWYDVVEPHGNTLDPSDNADMISAAFWLQQGTEFKITKSDDPKHTALLTTTGDCLNGMTFRAKMKSYGVFRGKTSWATNKCLGNCSVKYGGKYSKVDGFIQAQCDGVMQSKDGIGFWCNYYLRHNGDGAVLMIGGGGIDCGRADHGIGVTGTGASRFAQGSSSESDFGNQPFDAARAKLYSLNLWVLRG